MDMPTGAAVRSICLVHADRPDGVDGSWTAIDKRPAVGAVRIGELGAVGDRQLDTKHHGGPDQALYAVSATELQWWAQELGRELPDGSFGENLTIVGLDVDGARAGERWRIGAADDPEHVVVEVTTPRIPCATFARWIGQARWVVRYTERGNPGTYLRVVRPGSITPGAELTVLPSDAHAPTIREVFAARTGRA